MASGDPEAAVEDNDALRDKTETTVEHPSGINSGRFLKSPGVGEAEAFQLDFATLRPKACEVERRDRKFPEITERISAGRLQAAI